MFKNLLSKPFALFFAVPVILFACNTATQHPCPPHDNPYGLEIIHCLEDYHLQIKSDPNMELQDLEVVIPGITLDIRYATTNNFTGEVIYTAPKAYLRKPVATALKKVQDSLSQLGIGLIVFDAYRPYAASVKFFEVYSDTNFVANPKHGSRHNRGCAVDVSLLNLTTNEPLSMPSLFDDFSIKAHPENMEFSDSILRNRSLLFDIMKHFGFSHYPTEWWHFDYQGWESFPLMDLPFELLAQSNGSVNHNTN